MLGDKELKMYGTNTVGYELDRGWVVPEIAPDPEYFPPYVPPSTDPNDLELITGIQWVTGKLDPTTPPIEDVIVLSGRYTTRWIKVKPDTRYIISSKFTNAFVMQSKTEAGVISYFNIPSNIKDANTAIKTKLDSYWIRFYFYVGYEVLHELSLQEHVVADPVQIPPFKVTEIELGYFDGNQATLKKDPYAFNKTTGWFDVKPNTSYLMYFSSSNRCYIQLRGKDTAYNGSVSYPITFVTNPALDSSANNKTLVTKANTIQARVYFSSGKYTGDVIQMFEQLPPT